MKKSYNEEKIEHHDLMEMLRRYFSQNEDGMQYEDDMEGDDVDSMEEMISPHEDEENQIKTRRSLDSKHEEDMFDDSYDESEDDESEEDDKKLSKDKRKQLSIMVIGKRVGKKRKAM